MRGGFRDGGNGDGHQRRYRRPVGLGQREGRQRKQRAIAQLPGGGHQRIGREGLEEVAAAQHMHQQRSDAPSQRAQQQRQLPQDTL